VARTGGIITRRETVERLLQTQEQNSSVPDPGSGAFLTPGSQTLIFESLMTIFWVESSIILCKFGPIFFLHPVQNQYNFVIFVSTKKVGQQIFFTPLFCCCFWIRDGKKSGSEIRDKQHCNTANRINVPLLLLLCTGIEHRSERENSDFSEPVFNMMPTKSERQEEGVSPLQT
jgi:hypothetical protein